MVAKGFTSMREQTGQAQVLSLKPCVPRGCTVQLCLLVKYICLKSYPSGSAHLAKINMGLSSLKVRISRVRPLGLLWKMASILAKRKPSLGEQRLGQETQSRSESELRRDDFDHIGTFDMEL